MTTSGSIDFTLNRNQLILAAFRKVGAFATGETPDADSINDAAIALNALVKHWETSGLHLWTETEGTLWLQPDQYQYALGPTSTDHATLSSAYSQTTLTSDAANGATTIVVAATTGFAAGVNVGVMLDDGSIEWHTESGAPAGSTITLTTGLGDSAASGNLVWVYATADQAQRPLRIVAARTVYWNSSASSQIENPTNPMLSRLDYRALPNKSTNGVPTQTFYDPQLGNGQFYVWPSPQNSLYGIRYTFYRAIEDFDAAANTPDLPQEWLLALTWNLAYEIAPEYDCPPKRYAMIEQRALRALDDVRGWDREPESILAGPALHQRSGY